ncbi:gamma carbonic anhydrase family protein [Tistrella mobilis]
MAFIYAYDDVVPVIDPTAFVHETAVLIGDVIIGPEVYVGPGASLRGDSGRISVLRGANLQDNVVAHTYPGGEVVVGEAAAAGHGAVLHGCRLGQLSLVGMNAVVMDDAEIGDFSVVAAMSFVKTGMKVPPRTMVAGVPAKPLREVGEAEIGWIREGALSYDDLRRRGLAGELRRAEPLTAPEPDRRTVRAYQVKPLSAMRG